MHNRFKTAVAAIPARFRYALVSLLSLLQNAFLMRVPTAAVFGQALRSHVATAHHILITMMFTMASHV